jgi:hypothetical protein
MARANFADLEKYLPTDGHKAEFRALLAYSDTLADNDEILKVIRAMGLFASIAQTVPVEMAKVLAEFGADISALRAEFAASASVPAAIAEAAAAVNVKTDGIAKAAKEMSDISAKVVLVFTAGGFVLGGAITAAAMRFFGW